MFNECPTELLDGREFSDQDQFVNKLQKGFHIDAYMMALLTSQIANGSAPSNHRGGFRHQYENLPQPLWRVGKVQLIPSKSIFEYILEKR